MRPLYMYNYEAAVYLTIQRCHSYIYITVQRSIDTRIIMTSLYVLLHIYYYTMTLLYMLLRSGVLGGMSEALYGSRKARPQIPMAVPDLRGIPPWYCVYYYTYYYTMAS